jgi:hypothetical protein
MPESTAVVVCARPAWTKTQIENTTEAITVHRFNMGTPSSLLATDAAFGLNSDEPGIFRFDNGRTRNCSYHRSPPGEGAVANRNTN